METGASEVHEYIRISRCNVIQMTVLDHEGGEGRGGGAGSLLLYQRAPRRSQKKNRTFLFYLSDAQFQDPQVNIIRQQVRSTHVVQHVWHQSDTGTHVFLFPQHVTLMTV